MQEKRKRRNAKSKYSPAVVRAVLYDVRTSSQTLAQIAAKYGLPKGSGSMISKWVKKYSSDFSAMEDLQPAISNANHLSPAAKSSGENELQKKLEEARRKIICLETMIDITEREIGVDIRKKSGTKQ
jgi:transposase-like protein